jgi:hypothetical protein
MTRQLSSTVAVNGNSPLPAVDVGSFTQTRSNSEPQDREENLSLRAVIELAEGCV